MGRFVFAGRRAGGVLIRGTRLPGGGVIRSLVWKPDDIGFCSSPVERLAENQRAAGSTPAGAIDAAVAKRQTRDAQTVVGAIPEEVQVLPASFAVTGR